jgi:hypothetical protein
MATVVGPQLLLLFCHWWFIGFSRTVALTGVAVGMGVKVDVAVEIGEGVGVGVEV